MALTIESKADLPCIELEAYLEELRSRVDPDSRDSVLASSAALAALGRNKALLRRVLHDDIRSALTGQDSRFYSHHSFILGSVKGMTVRGNLWPRVRRFESIAHRKAHVDKVYAYGLPHDHNFDLLTVGWHGPGYETEIFEYDTERVQGFPDEAVSLRFLERTTLPEGKIMFFRDGQDVHIQHPPVALSVSLNLLVRTANTSRRAQYIFDVERGRITGLASGTDVARTVLAIRFATLVANGDTVQLLEDLVHASQSPHVRSGALAAMVTIDRGLAEHVRRLAESDASELVKCAGALP